MLASFTPISAARALLLVLLPLIAWSPAGLCAQALGPRETFVMVNGVRLQALDWGGRGSALILIHGLADNPHVFDDLAPAFVDRFRVIAYARRGCGTSQVKGPYDIATLTEDLRALMDALGIAKADLIGYSAGGDEITAMAIQHPDRVGRIIYFDGGYDWSDPDFKRMIDAGLTKPFALPEGSLTSLNAFMSAQKSTNYPSLDDMHRLDANLREKVIVQSDGSLKNRTNTETVNAFYGALWTNPRRDYRRVHSPALAIYAAHLYDLNTADPDRHALLLDYQNEYWQPFQRKSIALIERDLVDVKVTQVPGTHGDFVLTARARVVAAVRRFLGVPSGGGT